VLGVDVSRSSRSSNYDDVKGQRNNQMITFFSTEKTLDFCKYTLA